MIESSELRWLHISDLHIGSPANEWVDTTLRVKLKDLLQRTNKYVHRSDKPLSLPCW